MHTSFCCLFNMYVVTPPPRKNQPSLFERPREIWHVFKLIHFFKMSFDSPKLPWNPQRNQRMGKLISVYQFNCLLHHFLIVASLPWWSFYFEETLYAQIQCFWIFFSNFLPNCKQLKVSRGDCFKFLLQLN